MKIDWAVPLLIAWFTMVDTLERWYRSFDRDIAENGLLESRWISWGTFRACSARLKLSNKALAVREGVSPAAIQSVLWRARHKGER